MAINYTFAFKFWFILSFVFLLLDQALFCSFDLKLSFQQPCSIFYQSLIPFLFFNFFAQHNLHLGILDILCSFAVMSKVFTEQEKKYFTLYMIFDVLLRNIFILITAVMVFIISSFFYEGKILFYDYPFGWHSLMIYYYWKNAQQNPQVQSQFFYIRRKYTKWILMIVTMVLTLNIFTIAAASLLPDVQGSFYRQGECEWYKRFISKMQKKFCYSQITERDDFIKMKEINNTEEKQEELVEDEAVQSQTVFEKGMGINTQGTSQSKEDMEIAWKQKN